MRNTLLILCFLLTLTFSAKAEIVVFDPATYDPADLPNPDSMEIVSIDGTDYLRIVTKGWNDIIPVDPVLITQYVTGFQCEVKMAAGATGGYPLADVNTFLKLTAVDGTTEIAASGAGSTATFAVRTVAIAASHINESIGNVQVAGQKNAAPNQWSATYGDTLWLGKITLNEDHSALVPGLITRETFGTLSFDTGNPIAQPTGFATGYNWTDVTDFTSENGHIEAGSDSSVRINTYGNAYSIRGPLVDFSAGAHALIVDRSNYLGSWDTLLYLGIDLGNDVATSIEFSYAKVPSWFINNDTNVINVEYRINGADWIQLDTSLIDTLYKGIWDYVSLPVNNAQSGIMDIRLSALSTSQVTIDDLAVYGLVEPAQGTNSFTVDNLIVGTVDDAADYTCNLTAIWDADSIYMDFVITDDSIVGTGTNYQIDNLEVYFDMDNSKNIHWPRNGGWVSGDPTYDDNDYQIRLVADSAYTASNHVNGAKLIYEVTDTGYNFSLNIAWDSLMVGFDGVDTAVIGFDVLASDNDAVASDANRNQLTLNSPTDKPFNDPSLFATFAFRPEGRFEIIPDETNPSAPANFAAVCADSVITVTWDNATDNIAVLRYEVLRGGVVAGTVYAQEDGNTFRITDLAPAEYSISVRALDNYSNVGAAASAYVTCEAIGVDPAEAIEFSVFPNPASTLLTINAEGAVMNAQIISIAGTVVMNVNNANQLDLSGLKAGLYMIKVTTDTEVYSTTFVKE